MSAVAEVFNIDDVQPVEWAEPMPLSGVTHEPKAYPLDALPDGLRAAVADVQATTQAPLAMVATGALTALSLAGQGRHTLT